MPDFAADDFATIAARWKEIRAEADAAKPACQHCENVGWVRSADAVPAVVFLPCPECRNPLDRPSP